MTDSSVGQPVEGLAVGYGRRMPDGSRARMPFVDARGMAAATGITSTVGDMARYVAFQFRKGQSDGGHILSAGSLREMHRIRVPENNWQRGSAVGFAFSHEKDKVYVSRGGSYFGYKTHTLIQLNDRAALTQATLSRLLDRRPVASRNGERRSIRAAGGGSRSLGTRALVRIAIAPSRRKASFRPGCGPALRPRHRGLFRPPPGRFANLACSHLLLQASRQQDPRNRATT